MKHKRIWLVCAKCGKKDESTKTHVGTDVVMRCRDCANSTDPHATMCRDCCPTGHGTCYDAS